MPITIDSAISLLIIDNDSSSLNQLSGALAQPGLKIMAASDPEPRVREAAQAIAAGQVPHAE